MLQYNGSFLFHFQFGSHAHPNATVWFNHQQRWDGGFPHLHMYSTERSGCGSETICRQRVQ